MDMEQSRKNLTQENFDTTTTTMKPSQAVAAGKDNKAKDASYVSDFQNSSSRSSLYGSAMDSTLEYKSFKDNSVNANESSSSLSEDLLNAFNGGYTSSSSSSVANLSLSAAEHSAINNTLGSESSGNVSGNDTSSKRSEVSRSSSGSTSNTSSSGAGKPAEHNNNNNNDNNNAANEATNAILTQQQSESTETNTSSSSSSQEDVDPKSKLANRTIFKSDNPNLSIIEISNIKDNSIESENSVLIFEEPKDFEKLTTSSSTPSRRSPSTVSSSASVSSSGVSSAHNLSTLTDISLEKRRKKPESLLQSSRQKLNVEIAEASAAKDGSGGDAATTAATAEEGAAQSSPRRKIKIYETIEEFEQNLPTTVTVLDTPFGSKVYLVGTAHFSEESQDDVSFVIRNVRPDVVMVELCPSRIHMLKLDEQTLLEEAKNINLTKFRSIVQTHGYITGIFFIMLLQMSAQTTKDLGMAPGGEFRRAFEEIQRLPGCMLHLGDRPIRITLIRALRALSFWQTIKLGLRLLSSDTISIEEVEECKKKDLLEKLMEEMAGEFPAFSDVFVRERDMFLCHSLQVAALPQNNSVNGLPRPMRVVGIVGIGHAKGIAKMWGRVDPRRIPEIMEIPPASLSTRIGTLTFKYGFIALTLYGAFRFLRPRLTKLF